MSEENNKNNKPENPEDDYIGNMWGWKFSFISLGIIILTAILVFSRGEEAFEDAKKEPFLEVQNPYLKKDTLKK